jgi:small subunit ribosomal protein S16
MATHIRLSRVGRNKQAAFRIVVSDSEHARDGRRTEEIGHYNPRREPPEIVVDEARALHWLRQGARPTETVVALLKRAGVWAKWTEERRAARPAT